MKRLSSILLLIFLVASMSLSVCAVSSIPKPVIKATESVVRVHAEYSDGYTTGSGFIIKSDRNETLIATNYHVVESNPLRISVWIGEEGTVSATILAYTGQKDMCILRLAYPVSLKPLTFAEDDTKQGDAVYAVGFPGAADALSDTEAHAGSDATITDGIVSAVREATVSNYGTPTKILQINAAINSGNSGGPLFNEKGEVVGINTYGIDDSQGIFGAIDVSELKEFMAYHSIPIPSAKSPLFLIILAFVVIALVGLAIVLMRKKKKINRKVKAKNMPLDEYMAAFPNGVGMNSAVAMLLPVALQLRDLHNNGKAHLQVSPHSISVGVNSALLNNATLSEADRYASGYAAPEIYRGTSAGNLSDIYSFCALLSYVASGKQPANALSRADGETEDSEDTQFDPVFTSIIDSGMALDPAERFRSMQDIIIKFSSYNTMPFERELPLAKEEKVPKIVTKKRKKLSPKAIAILSVTVLVVALLGTYFGCYIGARVTAINGDLEAANKLLLIPQITKLYDPKLVAYIEAGQMMSDGKFEEAKTAFEGLSGYLDADNLVQEASYRQALQCADNGDFEEAQSIMLSLSSKYYRDSAEKYNEIKYRYALALIDEGEYLRARDKINNMRDYPGVLETLDLITELIYEKGKALFQAGDYSEAREYFESIENYADSKEWMELAIARRWEYLHTLY